MSFPLALHPTSTILHQQSENSIERKQALRLQPSAPQLSHTREPRPLFKRITEPWDREEDDYSLLIFIILSGSFFYGIPLLLFPFFALTRLRVLVRMTLLDFWICSIVAGNWFAYWYSQPVEPLTQWLIILEGLMGIALGAAWSIRTAESLEYKNLRRAWVCLCGTLALPLTFGGLGGNFWIARRRIDNEYLNDWMFVEPTQLDYLLAGLCGIVALYCWFMISGQSEAAKTKRKGATTIKLRSDAIDRIDARRNEKEVKKRRREEHAQLLLQRKLKKTASSTKKPASQI